MDTERQKYAFRKLLIFAIMAITVILSACKHSSFTVKNGVAESSASDETELTSTQITKMPTSEAKLTSPDSEMRGINAHFPFLGKWTLDSVALVTMHFYDFNETLDLRDYIGYEIEYTPEYFRFGNDVFQNPGYVIGSYTLGEIYKGANLETDIWQYIEDNGIHIDGYDDYDYPSEVPLMSVEVTVNPGEKRATSLGIYFYVLNKDYLFIGGWGQILLAKRIDASMPFTGENYCK